MSKLKTYQTKPEGPSNKKSSIPLLHEVEIIYTGPIMPEPLTITSSKDAHEILKKVYDSRKIDYKEMFHVLLLNRRNYCIGAAKTSVGSTTATVVNHKEIFQLALKSNCTGIILSHNHPSGNTEPSESDKSLTKTIKEGCKLLDIHLLDHIIISSTGYYSFADEGEI